MQNCSLASKAVKPACTLTRLRATSVNSFLKESSLGARSDFNPDACNSFYLLRTLIKAPNCFLSEGLHQLSILGPILESQASLYWSGSDCRPCCFAQQMQNCQIIKTTIDDAI